MEAALNERLDSALRGIVLRAWRLHLETPGVQATVPMLRGVWGRAQGAVRATVPSPVRRRRHWHAAVCTAARVPEAARRRGRVPPVRAARPPGQRYRLGGSGPHLATADSARNGIPLSCPRFDHWFGTVRRWARTAPSPGFTLCPLPWPAGDPSGACRLEFLAPLRLIYSGRLVEQPTLANVTIAALRRVQSLTTTKVQALHADRLSWLNAAALNPV